MSNLSARDLLRRAREQKRNQKSATLPSSTSRQPTITDSDARTDSKGNLYCRICNLQIKPADIGSWKVHLTSRRHQQQSGTTAKRQLETDGVSDISKLSIGSATGDTALKRQKVEHDDAQSSLLVGYGSESEAESAESPEKESDKLMDDEPAEGTLPAGFFDDGVDQDTGGIQQDNNVEEIDDTIANNDPTSLPSGFFDNPDEQTAAETGTSLLQVSAGHDRALKERLAEFENDLAGLAEPSAAPREADDVDIHSSLEEELEEELEQQSEMWRHRTDKLIKLRSIIREGVRDMDPNEDLPVKTAERDTEKMDDAASNDSCSDSESDFADLLSWRRQM